MTIIGWALAAIEAIAHVPATYLDAIAQVESGWDPSAVSTSGCVGIYQLMPRYSAIPRELLKDPLLSRMEAARQLRGWYARSGRNWPRALAAYNCGWRGLKGKCGTNYARKIVRVMRRGHVQKMR
jgi:soluble lytic murein transglycosylase-like protein